MNYISVTCVAHNLQMRQWTLHDVEALRPELPTQIPSDQNTASECTSLNLSWSGTKLSNSNPEIKTQCQKTSSEESRNKPFSRLLQFNRAAWYRGWEEQKSTGKQASLSVTFSDFMVKIIPLLSSGRKELVSIDHTSVGDQSAHRITPGYINSLTRKSIYTSLCALLSMMQSNENNFTGQSTPKFS